MREARARWKTLEKGRIVMSFCCRHLSMHSHSTFLVVTAPSGTSQIHLPPNSPGAGARLGLFHADRLPGRQRGPWACSRAVSRAQLHTSTASLRSLPPHSQSEIKAKAKHFKGKTKQKHLFRQPRDPTEVPGEAQVAPQKSCQGQMS